LIVIEYFWPSLDHALHLYTHRFGGERGDRNKPRRTWQDLGRGQDASEDKALCRSHADTKALGSLHQTDHFVISSDGVIARQAEAFTHLLDADRRPGLAIAGLAVTFPRFRGHRIKQLGALPVRE